MGKVKTELSWATAPETMKVRMRELAQEGSWEAFISLIKLRDELPPTEMDAWRDAADDCLERYLTDLPGPKGDG